MTQDNNGNHGQNQGQGSGRFNQPQQGPQESGNNQSSQGAYGGQGQQAQRPRYRPSINNVQLLGNVGQAPEITYKDGKVSSARFSIAVDASYTNQTTGQFIEQTRWFNCVAFGRVAENIEKGVKVGVRLLIHDARLDSSQYLDKKTNEKRTSVQVIVNRYFYFDSKRPDGDSQNHLDGNFDQNFDQNYSNEGDYPQDQSQGW